MLTIRAAGRQAQFRAWLPPLLALVHAALLCSVLAGRAAASEATWILVDTTALTLQVMRGESVLKHFDDIAVGRNGTSGRKVGQDGTTPLGTYRISDIRSGDQSRYHRFLAIDYPSLEDALRAHDAGRLSAAELESIRRAHERGEQPPASTALGGHIGIHGIGRGDIRIHRDFNWTDGCVALTNEQVDELAEWVRRGMTVVIL